MTIDAWITVIVLTICVGGLFFSRVAPDVILLGGLAVLLTSGVINPLEGLAGFSNQGTLTIAVLYAVAAGLSETGALDSVVTHLFRQAKSVPIAQIRVMTPVTVMSAFINNTPIVASFIPAVNDWARKQRMSPSKLMMPLSYAAIFGGCCTLVGTSTNLIVNGLLIAEPTTRGLGFFELAWVGLPCAVVGFVYVLLATPRLLPVRVPPIDQLQDPREYTVEMLVEDGSPLAGQTIESAGLRHLPSLFLIEIERGDQVIPAVSPYEVLEEGDRLVFAGITDSIIELQRIRGLKPATEQVFKLDAPRAERRFIEAAVAARNPVVGRTVRQGRFRSRYDAVVIAVARDGRRVKRKIGDIRIMPGDTLLLETDADFIDRHRNSRDFALLRPVDGAAPPRHERAWLAWIILVGIVVCAGLGVTSLLTAAMLGAGLMLATGVLTTDTARNSVDLQVILVIAAAFGIGSAVEASGAGHFIATKFLTIAGTNPATVLAFVYVMTSILTAVITNNAAAALMFPIVIATANELSVSPLPYAVAIALAASASFATPIGYQTNLMVYGPGGYRFADYLRFGLPLNILIGITAIIIIPRVWAF